MLQFEFLEYHFRLFCLTFIAQVCFLFAMSFIFRSDKLESLHVRLRPAGPHCVESLKVTLTSHKIVIVRGDLCSLWVNEVCV